MSKTRFLLICTLLCFTFVALRVVANRPRNSIANDPRNDAVIVDYAARPLSDGPQPVAYTGLRAHDFGAVEPNRTYQFKFPIRNDGEGPLKLSKESTTSRNLSVNIDPHTLMPGKTGDIIVDWDAYPSEQPVAEHAVIATSDPRLPLVDFEVRGKPLVQLAAEPAILRALAINPGKLTRLETIVGSPLWPAFALDVKPSLASITCQTEPVDDATLKKLKIRSGWRVIVTLPDDLPSGAFREKLRLVARPQDPAAVAPKFDVAADAAVERELPIEGSVRSRLAVFGDDIDQTGSIAAGTVKPNMGYDGTFTVRVNDPEPQLVVEKVAANPAQIEARLEPFEGAGNPGVYRLHVHIPPSDIPAAHVGASRGKLTLTFDHPRIKKLELGVTFVVLNSIR